jgi:hypothetical protein
MSALIEARLQRRVSITVRSDAAQQLTNGRILYDALFTRTGYQTYPRADGSTSVEYRPPSEVFRADSLASLANLPGVLLHPSQNFGTKFDGDYDVKGCTGSKVVEHTDHIHTAGTLCVWSDDWNAAIERGDIADLSAGYTITPGPGGVGPDGTRFDVLHTGIIGDHMAGVPAGNAGTACVVLDARSKAAVLASRKALADIAACRMDARPLYHILGQWPHRESPRMDDITAPDSKEYVKRDALAAAAPRLLTLGPKATARQVLDVWIDVCGLSDDPAMLKVCRALGEMEAPGSASSGAPVMDAAALERQVLDVAEQADRRADALEFARRAIGLDYVHRTALLDAERKPVMDAAGKPATTPKTIDAIKRDIITKLDASRLAVVDAYTEPAQRAVALDMQLAEVRKIFDAKTSRAPVDALLEAVERTRGDNASGDKREPTPEQVAVADKLAAQADPNRQAIFGRAPPPAATPAR